MYEKMRNDVSLTTLFIKLFIIIFLTGELFFLSKYHTNPLNTH